MLGRKLVSLAPSRDWSVRATWFGKRPALRAEWVQADVRDTEAVAQAMKGVDAVVHTAYRQADDAWSTNVDGSEVVARAAAGARLVHLSSDIVFDGTLGHYSEEDKPSPVNDYGRSKAEAELRVADAHPGATIVRTSLIYGTPDGPQERLAREGKRFLWMSSARPFRSRTWRRRARSARSRVPGPAAIGGSDDISRYDFAVLLGADAEPSNARRRRPTVRPT